MKLFLVHDGQGILWYVLSTDFTSAADALVKYFKKHDRSFASVKKVTLLAEEEAQPTGKNLIVDEKIKGIRQ